jgi:hypothetical protein
VGASYDGTTGTTDGGTTTTDGGTTTTDGGTTTTDGGTTTTDGGTTTTDGGTTDGSDSGSTTTDGSEPAPVNSAPVISGSPAGSVMVNESYSFQPVAADADGDLLAYSIINQPGWAGFDDTTGRLSGVPADSDVGTYSNIQISVTDGAESATLPAFSIQVEQAQALTGDLNLEWVAPVERSDGTPLSLADIDGFKVHYGETAGNYTTIIDVPDGSAQSLILNDLPVGTYYVVMTTYDVNGLESDTSNEVAKTVY